MFAAVGFFHALIPVFSLPTSEQTNSGHLKPSVPKLPENARGGSPLEAAETSGFDLPVLECGTRSEPDLRGAQSCFRSDGPTRAIP